MEITPRQLERILTCAILLEETCETERSRNSIALRAVKLIREQLDDIEAAAGPGESLELPEYQPDLPFPGEHPSGQSDEIDAIRAYGRALLAKGITLHGLFDGVCRKFDLTQDKLSRLIGVNQGSLSKFMRLGLRAATVTTAAAEFFGDGRD